MRTLLVAMFLVGSAMPASAANDDPPDVLHGERYDGRTRPSSARKYLLAVPRGLLLVPRLFMKGLGAVAKPLMEWSERNHVPERVNDALTSSDGLVGVRPVIDFELAFKPSFGALYFNNRIGRGAQLGISTAFGGPEIVLQSVHLTLPVLGGRAGLDFDARYLRRDDVLFTGIGRNSQRAFGRYGVDQVDASVDFSMRAMKMVRFELGADLGIRRFANGSAYGGDRSIAEVYCVRVADRPSCIGRPVDETLVPGFAHGTQFVREHVDVHLDSRKDELGTGLLVDAGVQYTHGFSGDDSSYLRIHGRVGTSFELWRRRALYLGVTADDLVAFGSTPIPFSELVQLGGPDDLRGFQKGRFRDASSLIATVEYRWPVWMWMDGSLFADYGGVLGPGFRGLSFADLRADVGMGLRVHTVNKFVLRIQVAYGFGDQGGVRLVIAGNGNPS
jgi:hypothetical protein